MPAVMTQRPALNDRQFRHISDLVKRACGINLHDGKLELVHSRLNKRLRQLGLDDFDAYLQRLEGPAADAEMICLLDLLSTNVTQFFREPQHFDFLREEALPALASAPGRPRRLRVWSAGCSSGEEPFTIAMVLREELLQFAHWDVRILATDLSTAILARARAGIYSNQRLRDVPGLWRGKHFQLCQAKPERLYRVSDELRAMVAFARLNLLDRWPMQGPFDFIFCRNVMIYFDKAVQGELVRRFSGLLAPGGYLLFGHSESLAGVRHGLRYVRPTIYCKP